MEETTTQDVNISQGEVGAASTPEKPVDNLDEKSLTEGFWGDRSSEQSEAEAQETEQAEEKSESSEAGEGEEQNQNQNTEHPRAEARERQLNEDIRSLVSRKHELENQISQLESMTSAREAISSQRVTPEDLEAAGLDSQEAAVQSLLHNQELDRQEAELNNVQADIADLQFNLVLDRVELLKDYPVFDEGSPEFDGDFANMAVALYQEAADVKLGENGMPISANLRLYDFMAQLAKMYTQAGERNRAKFAAAKQQAAAMNVGGASIPNGDDEETFIKEFFEQGE